MKKLITLILILLTFNVYSQIGIKQEEVLSTYDISMYKVNKYSYELVYLTDTLMTIFTLDLSTEKVFSIEYVYPTVERLNKSLKIVLNGAVEISKDVYLKDKLLFMVKELEIQVLDIKYINRYK